MAANVTTAADLVAAAGEHIEQLDPERFATEAARPEVVVVDVREADERLGGSIAGAVHVPRGLLEFRADPQSRHHDDRLHPQRRVLLYCDGGARSALAAHALVGLGYTDLAHLAGGVEAWRCAGEPLVNEVVQPY